MSRNFPLVNVRFIRRVIGVLRGFLNFLKSLFEMLKGPLLLLFFSDLMQVIISSSEVKSNFNDCFIGFVRKSYVFLCRYNTLFNLFGDIAEKLVECIYHLLFLCYQLSIIDYVPNLLGVFFVGVDNLFDTCPNIIQFILIVFLK